MIDVVIEQEEGAVYYQANMVLLYAKKDNLGTLVSKRIGMILWDENWRKIAEETVDNINQIFMQDCKECIPC